MNTLERHRPTTDNSTALDRARVWTNLNEAALKREAAKAASERDAGGLWGLLEAYLTTESGVKSKHSLKAYRLSLQAFTAYADERGANLLRPGRHMGSDYRSHLSSTLAPSSVAVRLAGAKALYKALRWAGATSVAPFLDTSPPRDPTPPEYKRDPYSHDDVTAMLEACKGGGHSLKTADSRYLDSLLVLLLAHGGLRVGEATALTWRDVDVHAGHLWVAHGKGDKRRRVVVSDSLRDALERYPFRRDGRVFPFADARARQRLKRLCRIAGIHYRGAHSLRHYSGTRLLAETGRIESVKAHLGHSDIKTSQIYARMSDDVLERSVGRW